MNAPDSIEILMTDVSRLYQMQLRMQTDIIELKNAINRHDMKMNRIASGSVVRYAQRQQTWTEFIILGYVAPCARFFASRFLRIKKMLGS